MGALTWLRDLLPRPLALDNRTLLYRPSRPAGVHEDLYEQIDFMFDVMKRHGGIGLAANQIGLNRRVIVVRANGFKQEIINPQITRYYGGIRNSVEGCLSFPGKQVTKQRHRQIVVTGYNMYWERVEYRLKDLAAFVVQHEIDHLNGICIA